MYKLKILVLCTPGLQDCLGQSCGIKAGGRVDGVEAVDMFLM